ncbi:MAG: DUF4333 domain-containing protein [Actinophytocola sp.]|uniref:DUF4333 domain-containing protein n=1 Tax=Actinophytocola sp. TaxID=1872138 RepID=UPI003D6AD61C
MAQQRGDGKPEATITAAKIAVAGTIVAALIGATASITVALLNQDSDPAPEPPAAAWPTATPSQSAKKLFHESALEGDGGVQQILINYYGMSADQIEGVDCPADQEVVAGNEFTCTIELGGDEPGETTVDVTVRNSAGEYDVGEPRRR